jgi:hypothetical protein
MTDTDLSDMASAATIGRSTGVGRSKRRLGLWRWACWRHSDWTWSHSDAWSDRLSLGRRHFDDRLETAAHGVQQFTKLRNQAAGWSLPNHSEFCPRRNRRSQFQ